MLYQWIKGLLLPPTGLLLLILLGLAWKRRPTAGKTLAALATLSLLALSLPIVAAHLMRPLEPYPALDPTQLSTPRAQAILVLSAGRYSNAPEYPGDQVGGLTLQRLRYAAWLQRRTELPLLVSGGSPADESPPIAQLMKRTLEQEFAVPVAGIEEHSRTTRENARFSAALLARLDLHSVYLVSHAWHLPRAVEAFERAGIEVIPAPTVFAYREPAEATRKPADYIPHAPALLLSYYAIHEHLGRLWYQLRDRID